ncbi:F-box only protein 2-like [Ischnura elegans]|uniref:F-box only protein 2-like n=1 Tax=Ischnura elegans TaxID=197161 RepID=UPI001ED8A223|nr:F-box only protein 2-like [Ischnura elegans]
MACECLSYIACILLCYVIILIISRWLAQREGTSGPDGNADTPDSPNGGDEADGPSDGNLLRNNCGQDGLKYWTVMSNQGDGWLVENKPVGCDPLPSVDADGNPVRDFGGRTSCFATSSRLCMMEQVIDLVLSGFSREELDKKQPPIEISEWYAGHSECGSTYLMNVTLLDENKQNVCHYKAERILSKNAGQWKKVTQKFSKYGPGIRYVSFNHAGSCSEDKPGHYGCKMTGGIVRVMK